MPISMPISLTRRTALALAGTAAITLGAAGAAIATNSGLLGGAKTPAEVGTLDARNVSQLLPDSTLPAEPEIQYIDETIVVPGSPGPAAAPVGDDEPSSSGDQGVERDDPAPPPPASAGVTPPPAGAQPVPPPRTYVDDHGDDDDEFEHEDEREDEREDEHESEEHDD